MASPTPPLTDLAAPILAGDPVLSDEHRADLWDTFHNSKSPEELVQHLQPLRVPDDTKKRLYDAKKQSMPPVGPVDKVTAVMQKMTQIDPKMLDLAESHPNVLKTLTAAATTPEKGTESASGGTSPAGKGNIPAAGETPAPLNLPPRPDGLEHFPPIPGNHRRVMAHDGGIYDIPEENVNRAFELDPRLHILNP